MGWIGSLVVALLISGGSESVALVGVGVVDVESGEVLPGQTVLIVGREAGLTPLEALRTATLTPAQYMHVADSLGSIQPGMLADLVVLEGDPLADIRNTERISGVVANGRYLDRPALDLLLAEARRVHQR